MCVASAGSAVSATRPPKWMLSSVAAARTVIVAVAASALMLPLSDAVLYVTVDNEIPASAKFVVALRVMVNVEGEGV